MRKIGPSAKFCSWCGPYVKKINQQRNYFRRRFKQLNKEKYGTENGAERLRWHSEWSKEIKAWKK